MAAFLRLLTEYPTILEPSIILINKLYVAQKRWSVTLNYWKVLWVWRKIRKQQTRQFFFNILELCKVTGVKQTTGWNSVVVFFSFLVFGIHWCSNLHCPTSICPVLEPRDQEIREFNVVQKRTADFEAQKLWKGRSGVADLTTRLPWQQVFAGSILIPIS